MGSLGGHLPALQVVIPLIAAPLCVLLRRPGLAWGFATAVSWTALAVSVSLLAQVLEHGAISYALGGWAAPWGIEYRVDEVNAFVLLAVCTIGAAVVTFARDIVEREVPDARIHLFYTAWILCLTGLLGIAITGDAFNVFVFLEISSLSSYILISLAADRRSLTAAFRYLVLGTIGATFILVGIGLLYAMTGTLNMADLGARIPAVADTRTVLVAFAFISIGVALKMALFPLHGWLPNAYAYAPSAVSAFLAGTATKVSVYVLVRFYFTIFGAEFTFTEVGIGRPLLALALTGAVVASAVAMFQVDVKRMLAYSSIAQIGYMTLGIALASVTGLTAGLVHIFNHALIKAALFMAVGCVYFRTGSVSLAGMAGLGQRMPWTMAAFVFAALGLVGVPLTAGFISKWYLLWAALDQGLWPVAALLLVTSLMALIYTGRVIEAAYFRECEEGSAASNAKDPPLGMLLPMWALVVATYYFGVDTQVTLGVAGRAATALMGAGP